MSREIKFRAYDIKSQRMSEPFYVGWKQCDFGDFKIDVCNCRCKVIQFTGLKDKNGVEIYHRDIFKAFDGGVFEVIEYNGAYGYNVDRYFPFIPFANHTHLLFDADGKCDQIEIIGNKHTTPGLLEK